MKAVRKRGGTPPQLHRCRCELTLFPTSPPTFSATEAINGYGVTFIFTYLILSIIKNCTIVIAAQVSNSQMASIKSPLQALHAPWQYCYTGYSPLGAVPTHMTSGVLCVAESLAHMSLNGRTVIHWCLVTAIKPLELWSTQTIYITIPISEYHQKSTSPQTNQTQSKISLGHGVTDNI